MPPFEKGPTAVHDKDDSGQAKSYLIIVIGITCNRGGVSENFSTPSVFANKTYLSSNYDGCHTCLALMLEIWWNTGWVNNCKSTKGNNPLYQCGKVTIMSRVSKTS